MGDSCKVYFLFRSFIYREWTKISPINYYKIIFLNVNMIKQLSLPTLSYINTEKRWLHPNIMFTLFPLSEVIPFHFPCIHSKMKFIQLLWLPGVLLIFNKNESTEKNSDSGLEHQKFWRLPGRSLPCCSLKLLVKMSCIFRSQ